MFLSFLFLIIIVIHANVGVRCNDVMLCHSPDEVALYSRGCGFPRLDSGYSGQTSPDCEFLANQIPFKLYRNLLLHVLLKFSPI